MTYIRCWCSLNWERWLLEHKSRRDRRLKFRSGGNLHSVRRELNFARIRAHYKRVCFIMTFLPQTPPSRSRAAVHVRAVYKRVLTGGREKDIIVGTVYETLRWDRALIIFLRIFVLVKCRREWFFKSIHKISNSPSTIYSTQPNTISCTKTQ